MKKALKYIASFFAIVLLVACVVFTGDSSSVRAADTYSLATGEEVSYKNPISSVIKYGAAYQKIENNVSENNYVSITSKGVITIRYTHGFSELIVLAQKCTKYYDKDKNEIKKLGDGETPAYCGGFSSQATMIHFSGSRRTEEEGYSEKTIHLFNYFNYDEIVKVRFIYEFDTSGNNENFYSLRYCNEYIEYDEGKCDSGEKLANEISLTARIGVLKGEMLDDNESIVSTNTYDKLGLVFNGTKELSLDDAVGGGETIVQVDNTKVDGASKEIENVVYDTVIPALIAILTIAAGVTCVVLGSKIVKSSDDPQERQEHVCHLRNVLIGVAIAYILLFAAEPAVKFIEGFLK